MHQPACFRRIASLYGIKNSIVLQHVFTHPIAVHLRCCGHHAADEAEMLQELDSKGLLSKVRLKKALAKRDRNWMLLELQVKRVENNNKTYEFQLQEKKLAVKRAESVLEERERDLKNLTVTAGYAGILQQIGPSQETRLEVGQRVTTGGLLARITNPTRLKAVLRIAETQMNEVIKGQKAMIDTRIGIVPGQVSRIDPAAIGGEVTVDVELSGELPRGARPDLGVVGTIEIARLEDVRFMSRPVETRAGGEMNLFKLEPDGKTAVRTFVQIGQTSVNTVEIVGGLERGDEVILSQMDQFEDVDRIAVE